MGSKRGQKVNTGETVYTLRRVCPVTGSADFRWHCQGMLILADGECTLQRALPGVQLMYNKEKSHR